MKKKQHIRVVLLLLCIVLLCSMPAYAMETRASDRINMSAATIGKASNGDLRVYFMVQTNGKMDMLGATSVEIQRKTITGWVTEYAFTSEKNPDLLTTNDSWHSAWLTYTPLFPGKSYRAVANIYVKNSTGTSTQWLPSDPVT